MSAIALSLLLQAAATPPAPPLAPWTPVARTNAAGVHSMVASTNAADGSARLVVKCDRLTEGVVSIQFIPKERLVAGGVQPVSLQFDGGTPMGTNWERMGGAALTREDGAVTTLVAAIAHARTIKLHTGDGGAPPRDVAFTGPPSDAPMRQVLAACGYTLGQVPVRASAPAPAPAPTSGAAPTGDED